MDTRSHQVDISRLAGASFVVVLVVFALFRLLGVEPWTWPAYDLYAYWMTRDGLDYAFGHQGDTGAYLYSPAFAQLISPLTALPWQVFAGIWTLVLAAPLLWLAGPWALPLFLLPPIAMSVTLGQLDLAFALVVILGWRWPAVWALPILTKVTPGVALVWFVIRREWRSFWIAIGTTALIALLSAAIDPAGWAAWLAMLDRREFPALGGGLWFLPVPLAFRLVAATMLVAWGAATDRRWVVPVGVVMSLPTIWVNSPTILVALLPLATRGAKTPAGAWLRDANAIVSLADARRRLPAWVRRVAA